MKWDSGPCVQFSGGISHRRYSDLVTDAVLIRRLIQVRALFIDVTPAPARPTNWRLSRCSGWLNSPPPQLLWMTVESSRPTRANNLTRMQVASRWLYVSTDDRRRSICLKFSTARNIILDIENFFWVSSLVNILNIQAVGPLQLDVLA